jgi:hypothetical protein
MREPYAEGAFWHSKLADAQFCLRKYDLKYIRKVQIPEVLSADLEFGQAMHMGLEDIMRGGDGDMVFNLYWETRRNAGLEYGRLDHDSLKNIGETLLARFKRLHFKHYEPAHIEQRIYTPLGKHAFEGTPDLLCKYKGRRAVVDFKTAAYRYDKRKIISDSQMVAYAGLAKQELGFEAEILVYVVFIKDPKAPSIQVIERVLTSEETYDILDNVIEICDDLAERKSFPMNTGSCIRGTLICPYFDVCHGKKGAQDE